MQNTPRTASNGLPLCVAAALTLGAGFHGETLAAQSLGPEATLAPPMNWQIQSSERRSALNARTGIGIGVASLVAPALLGAWMIGRSHEGLGGAMLFYAWVVGPAPALLYADDRRRALVGTVLRATSLALALAVTSGGTWDENGSPVEELAILAAIALAAGSSIADIASIPGSVRRHNDSLLLAPTFGPNGRVGLAIRVGR